MKNMMIGLVIFFSMVFSMEAQTARIQQLNNEILRTYATSERIARSLIRSREANAVLSERFALLEKLVEANPDEALAVSLTEETIGQLRRMYPDSPVESRGSVSGIYELEIEDGPQDNPYFKEIPSLRVGQNTYALHFSSRVNRQDINPGDTVSVVGILLDEEMLVADTVEVEAKMSMSCSSLGEQPIAVIKAKFPSTSPSLNNASLDDWMFSETAQSVNGYWQEVSYGKAWVTGDVFPAGTDAWYTLDREYACTESSLLRNAALQIASADVDFRNYTRVIIVFPKPSSGCSFAGRASIGCWVSNPDGGSSLGYTLQVLTSMGNRTKSIQLSSHELGHTLGLSHASSLSFGGNEPLGDPTDSGSRSEYGDRYASEGFWNLGHYSAIHKKHLKWIDTQTVNNDADILLTPSDSYSDVLLVPRNSSQTLWIEYIRQLGTYKSTAVSSPRDGVIIRLQTSPSLNTQSKLLNFGNSMSDADLRTGQKWNDPYTDLSLEIGDTNDGSALVKVRWGSTPCVSHTPTVSLSPATLTTTFPTIATFSLMVTNNDLGACSPSSFTLSSLVISGLQIDVDSPITTVSAGASTTTLVRVTPTIEVVSPTNYAVTVTAARPLTE